MFLSLSSRICKMGCMAQPWLVVIPQHTGQGWWCPWRNSTERGWVVAVWGPCSEASKAFGATGLGVSEEKLEHRGVHWEGQPEAWKS